MTDNVNESILYNCGNFALSVWTETDDGDDEWEDQMYEVVRYIPNDLYGKISEYTLATHAQNTSVKYYYKEPNRSLLIEEDLFYMKTRPEIVGIFEIDQVNWITIDTKHISSSDSLTLLEFFNFVQCSKFGIEYIYNQYNEMGCVMDDMPLLRNDSGEDVLIQGDFVFRKNKYTPYEYEIIVLKDNKYYGKKDDLKKSYRDVSRNCVNLITDDGSEIIFPKSYFNKKRLPFVLGRFFINKQFHSSKLMIHQNAIYSLCKDFKSSTNFFFFLKKTVTYLQKNCL